MFRYHLIALLIGTILNYFVGRIYSLWNPFDSIKACIKFLDRALLGDELILLEPSKQKNLGLWLIILVLAPVIMVVMFFHCLCFEIAPWLGVAFDSVAVYYCIEFNRCYFMGMNVAENYFSDGIDAMKRAFCILSGREAKNDDVSGVTDEAVTFIANETSDSVIAPMIIMAFFGPVGGFMYRTIELMDAVVGHHNNRYEYFGYFPAKLDYYINKVVGYLSGKLVVFAARHTFGGFNGKNARYIDMRDGKKAIGAFAGALNLQLKEGTVGDEDKEPEPGDIKKAAHLLKNSFFTALLIILILIILLK